MIPAWGSRGDRLPGFNWETLIEDDAGHPVKPWKAVEITKGETLLAKEILSYCEALQQRIGQGSMNEG